MSKDRERIEGQPVSTEKEYDREPLQPQDNQIMVVDMHEEVPLTERLRRFEHVLDSEESPKFLHLYLACPEEKAEGITTFIRERLQISENAKFPIQVNPHAESITDEIEELLPRIGSVDEKNIMVYATGYEDYFALGFTNIMREHRGGHDYDQNIREFPSIRDAKELEGKSLVVLTHIGKSQGQDAYERGIKSAAQSHFVDDVFITERPSYLRKLSSHTN